LEQGNKEREGSEEMWLRTFEGDLVNLNRVSFIRLETAQEGRYRLVAIEPSPAGAGEATGTTGQDSLTRHPLSKEMSKQEAEAVLRKLVYLLEAKWIEDL
jgi:formyltetrahydrofolate synthetase